MHVSHDFKCKTEYPFFCHEKDSALSDKLTVAKGMIACVRFFTSYGNDYLMNIQEGVNECPCGPHWQWFDYGYERCTTKDPDTNELVCVFKPRVLVERCEDYIELPEGCYRFQVLDCDYNPIVPGERDILLRVQHKMA